MKKEDALAGVVKHVDVSELHFRIAGFDALAAVGVGLAGKGLVLALDVQVFLGGQAEDGFDFLFGRIRGRRVGDDGHPAHAEPLLGLDENAVAKAHDKGAGVEVVDLSVVTELDAENMAHARPMGTPRSAAVTICKREKIRHLRADGKWRVGVVEIFSHKHVDNPGPSA
ncbi:hypothetical protein DSECCO2_597380 [anaerobic digester metagenome]